MTDTNSNTNRNSNDSSGSSGNNRNNNNKNRSNKGNNNGNKGKTSNRDENKFKGKCKDLEGFIFDANKYNQADKYIETVNEVAEYVSVEWDYGDDVKIAIEAGALPVFSNPMEPEKDEKGVYRSTTAEKKWLRKIDLLCRREETLETNMRKLYNLVWGQCSKVMREKLEGLTNYKQVKEDQDSIMLLELIKSINFKFEDQKYLYGTVMHSERRWHNFKQSKDESNNEYRDKFWNVVESVEKICGPMGHNNILLAQDDVYRSLDDDEKKIESNIQAAKDRNRERYLAFSFLAKADSERYQELRISLENDYTKGKNYYPETVSKALYLLTNHKDSSKYTKQAKNNNKNEKNVSFAQNNGKGKNNKEEKDDWTKSATCNECGETGHIRPQCPKLKDKKGTTNNNNGKAENSDSEDDNTEEKPKKKVTLKKKANNMLNIGSSSHRSEEKIRFCFLQSDLQDKIDRELCLHGSGFDKTLKSWILLDNQSTVNIFCMKELLTNIHEVDDSMNIETNGGILTTNQKGFLYNFGYVWYHPDAITNILSMKSVIKKYRVTFDSSGGNVFKVYKPDQVIIFTASESGLYYHDTQNRNVVFLDKVAEKKKKYSNRQYERAVKARELYTKIGCPSISDYKLLVKNCYINNCPITIEDINIAEDIFGPSIYALKGKTVRKAPKQVVTDYIEVPRDIMKIHKNVVLSGDVFFVQGYPFLVTLSRNIRFNTVEDLDDMTSESLLASLDRVFNVYTRRGFSISTILMDMQFQTLENDLSQRNINLNIASAGEHVGEIERFIRVIKERARALRSSLPYKQLPFLLVKAIVDHVSRWLNVFCPKGGISNTISPRTLLTGVKLDYNKDCRLEVGSYCQVHRDTTPRNDTEKYRTAGAIVLGRSNNLQGGYRFMHLTTGRVINSHQWNGPLPLTDEVIDRVEELAINEKHDFIFWDRNQNSLDELDDITGVETDSVITGVEDNDDSEYQDSENESEESDNEVLIRNEQENNQINDSDDDSDDDSVISTDLPNLQQRTSINDADSDDEDEDDNDVNSDDEDQDDNDIEQQELDAIQDAEDYFNQNHFDPETIYEGDDEDESYNQETTDDNSIGVDQLNQSEVVNERPKRGPKPNTLHYKPSFDNKAYERCESSNINIENQPTDDELWGKIFAQVISDRNFMNQFSLNKGLKTFGDKGKDAAFGELNQLHQRDAFKPIHPSDLSKEEKRRALETIVLIEEKRDGRIKGRAVADGRKQRGHVAKEDAASPTAALESIILTSIIDAKEGREVAVCDIPNAFIQTDMEGDTVIMRLRDKAAEILVQTAPELYRKYITIENGKTVLYVEALKALYGTLRAALLFYKKLLRDLKSIGFQLNPYDACVANKMINGKQFTIVWHVDDLKISHIDPREIDNFVNWLREMYEDDVGKIKVSRGKIHDYLGMTLDFSSEGEVKINMVDYVKRMIEAFPEERLNEATTPAALHLMDVRDKVEVLKEKDAVIFHNIVARGLFLCKRARPDIQPTIAFLTTRVSKPDLDDWKKLRRMIDYLRGTEDLVLTLSANNAMIIKWFVDVAYAVHHDMKSHTGGCLSLGKGFPIAASLKQKLNTKSSTESELVGTDDMMGLIIWTNYFLKAQGYNFTETIVYQDNKSAILLEKNGRASSGKRTKHINIRYFFIKDRIDNGEIKIEYCPTDDMVADFFTKPLQGKKFIYFRNQIMGISN